MNKKPIVLLILMSISLLIYGCSNDSGEKAAESLLKGIYEVKSYEAYESAMEKMENTLTEMKDEAVGGIISLDDSVSKEIYKPYIERYSSHTTEEGLDSLFSQGIATYMDNLAYSNKLYSSVDSVQLEKIKTTSENPEYKYTVNLKLTKGDKEEAETAAGIIGLERDEKGDYKVNFIKQNPLSLDKTVEKLSE